MNLKKKKANRDMQDEQNNYCGLVTEELKEEDKVNQQDPRI